MSVNDERQPETASARLLRCLYWAGVIGGFILGYGVRGLLS